MRKKTEAHSAETADFETALELTGFGKFHYELIAACALSVITLGFQSGLASYIFPSAQCELNLTSFELGLLNVFFLIGGTASCFLWGTLSDAIGRRKILSTCHFFNVLITVICVTNPRTSALLACRFLNGFFIGGPGSIIFSHIAEFQPIKFRSAAVCCCGLFFTSSWLLLPLIAYAVLQVQINFNVWDFIVLSPWRIFVILLTIPELIVGIWFLRLPESPKFFVAKGNLTKTLTILRRMYSTNTGLNPDEYPVKNLLETVKIPTILEKTENKLWRDVTKTIKTIGVLFKRVHIKTTILTCTIMFANMFGTFGLGLWLPELFIRFEQYHKQYPNATVTVKQLSKLKPTISSENCVPSFDSTVLLNTVAMAITAMVYNFFCSVLSSKINVNTVLLVSMILGGLSSASIYFLTSSLQNLFVACIFQASMITANMAVGSVGVNLFPTKASGVAMCLVMCFGRIGACFSNVVFGYFMDSNCEVPIFAVAAVVLFGGLLCVFIPTRVKEEKKSKNSTEVFVVETKFCA